MQQFNANNISSIAAGLNHNLALDAGGEVIAWGDDVQSQATVPENLTGVTTIAAGAEHNVTIIDGVPLTITTQPVSSQIESGESATLTVDTNGTGIIYQWYEGQSGDTSLPIDGATESTYTTGSLTESKFYWVRVRTSTEIADSETAVVGPFATLMVPLLSGWTWVSFNVTPEDASVGAVLQGYAISDNDVIKTITGSATFFGGQWFPSSQDFELETGLLYKVFKQSAGDESFEVIGLPADPSASIELFSAWNWIGVNLQEPAEVDVIPRRRHHDRRR